MSMCMCVYVQTHEHRCRNICLHIYVYKHSFYMYVYVYIFVYTYIKHVMNAHLFIEIFLMLHTHLQRCAQIQTALIPIKKIRYCSKTKGRLIETIYFDVCNCIWLHWISLHLSCYTVGNEQKSSKITDKFLSRIN